MYNPGKEEARRMRGKYRKIGASITPEKKKARGIRGKYREVVASTTPKKKEARRICGKSQEVMLAFGRQICYIAYFSMQKAIREYTVTHKA